MIYNVYSKPFYDYYNNIQDYKLKTWNKVIDANLTGAFITSQFLIKHFKNKKIKGNIILILSTYGIVGPNLDIYKNLKKGKNIYGGRFALTTPVSYTATKSGMLGLVKYISTTCGEYGIRSNALTPGGVFDNQEKNL